MSIHLPNAIWFLNQVLETFKEESGEGMDGWGVLGPGVFYDSPFSDFIADRASFLFGAIKGFLKSFEKEKIDFLKGKARKAENEMGMKMLVHKVFKKGNGVQFMWKPWSGIWPLRENAIINVKRNQNRDEFLSFTKWREGVYFDDYHEGNLSVVELGQDLATKI